MAEFDADTFAEQATLIGVLTRDQVSQAMSEAPDGSLDALTRVLMRKQALTSWQLERLLKGETTGFLFGDCVALFHLAEGTFARVYRGRKVHGNQPVAIKVLRKRFVSDQDAIGRFHKEAEAGLKLTHPNIVRIFDYGEHDRLHYMTMEYVEGSNLRDFLRFRTRLKPPEALPLMLGLARGLQYSLAKGVTHRDLKPTNILIASNGVAKLVDFGLATIEGDEKKLSASHGQRTVDYSNLERNCGSPKGDPRSDIFFLGCVYYQMITGQNPMPEADSKDPMTKMLRRNINAIKPISEHHHAPPEEVANIIERMMKVNLAGRYQTMDEVVVDLETYQAGAMGSAPAAPDDLRDESEIEAARARAGAEAVAKATAGIEAAARAEAEAEATAVARSVVSEIRGAAIAEGDDFEITEIKAKDVLCVEAQDPIRDALGKALTGMGYNVLLANDAEGAARRFAESPPDALLYDADGLGPKALDTFLALYKRAEADGRALAAVVILGPRQAELSTRFPKEDRVRILSKPLKLRDIQEAITRLVPAG